jgi:exodeoxyribonuclease V alpha subunit
MGFITDINLKEKSAVISFDGEPTTFRFAEFADLTLAYVISIHKSQGSEFPVVIMPMVKGFFHMLQKNLVYTGITRGKKLVVMVGDKSALAMAVRNNKPNERHGGLIHRLSATSIDWLEAELLSK